MRTAAQRHPSPASLSGAQYSSAVAGSRRSRRTQRHADWQDCGKYLACTCRRSTVCAYRHNGYYDGRDEHETFRQVPDNATPSYYDDEKEESRIYRRILYSYDDWKKHRSSYRYWHHLSTIMESRIVRGLMRPVAVITAIALAVATYQHLHAIGLLAASLPALPSIPIEPFQLTSFALSLLLVFRTNSSYARWYEGRRRFGRITTTCRDIGRQMLAMAPRSNVAARWTMIRWMIAFCRTSKAYIRESEPVAEELQDWLSPEELRALLTAPHPPNYALLVLSYTVASCGLHDIGMVRLEESLSILMRSLSSCNRILTTPIPLSYTRHTARFLILWLVLLPLALWPLCGWLMVPAAALISFVLLGIEDIGVQIEEPFSILALEKLCRKTERQLNDMMAMDEGVWDYVQAQTQARAPWVPAAAAPAAAAAAARSARLSADQAVGMHQQQQQVQYAAPPPPAPFPQPPQYEPQHTTRAMPASAA